jgi:iron complex outermembrane receptor protein
MCVLKRKATAIAAVIGYLSTCAPIAISASDNQWLMEEITVTARKREEGLQDAPLSVSAFTAEDLEYRGVTNISEIAAFTPNLVFQNNPSFGGASNAAAIYIRGIGQKEFLPTTEPGVGLYVDGVYIARSVGAILDLIDIERVEVLRGPQGTLFGRNTIGGAINITTKKPEEEFAGELELDYGSENKINLKGYANFGLTETLFASVNLASFQQDGYVDRTDGTDLGDDDTITGRVALRWLAAENVEVNFSVDSTRDRENGPALNLVGINLGNPVDPDTPPFAVLHNIGANMAAGGPPVPCAIPPAPLNLDVPGCYDNRYLASEGDNQGTAPAYSDTDIMGTNLTVDWQINDDLIFKSITAFRDLESEFARDGDHSPHTISEFVDLMDQDQFTQELQLLGSGIDSRLDWIVGTYYFEESGNNINLLDFTASRFRSGGKFDNESWAAFIQASYDLTDNLSLTAGLRYTDETKQFLPDQIIFENKFAGTGTPLDAPFLQAGSRILPFLRKEIDISETSPHINLAYNYNNGLMIYGTYSEGFKSGGFSQRVFPPIVPPFTAPPGTPDIDLIPTFEPEFVEVYEMGFKWTAADSQLKLNGAIFHTEYDDMQIQVFTSVAPVTKNAAIAEIDGFELELKALSDSGWFTELSVGYVDAAYTEIDEATTFVAKDNDFDRVSDWSVSGAISKDFSLDSNGLITARLDWSYHSSFFNDTFNTPQIAQDDSYEIVNANIVWLDAGEQWRVTLGVNNLLDDDYLITGIIGDAFQSYETMENRGREYWLSVSRKF